MGHWLIDALDKGLAQLRVDVATWRDRAIAAEAQGARDVQLIFEKQRQIDRLTSEVEGLTRIVGAVIQFEDCVKEFDGDIGCCHEYLDAVWAVMDDVNRPELVANARELAALLGKVPP